MRLVIFGSRTIPLEKGLIAIGELLGTRLSEVTEVISGTAIGADNIGEIWAKTHGIPLLLFPPDKKHGFPAALFIRNSEMAMFTDEGICLWDGESRGSQHMMKQMDKYNKPFKTTIIPIIPEPAAPIGLENFFE